MATNEEVDIRQLGSEQTFRSSETSLQIMCKSPLTNKQAITFKATYWKGAKDQLKIESAGKCAYCEANTDAVAHGDVEHYRPKSLYWWLAYTYDNYLFACQICNQVYKSDNFPIAGNLFPAPVVRDTTTDAEIDALRGKISPDPINLSTDYTLADYITAHQNEKPLLPYPYLDDPEQMIAYQADDMLKEVKIIPRKRTNRNHIKAMEKYYGLNRIELKNLRYKTYALFRTLKRAYPQVTDPLIKAEMNLQITAMLADDYVFAGMNRFYNRKF